MKLSQIAPLRCTSFSLAALLCLGYHPGLNAQSALSYYSLHDTLQDYPIEAKRYWLYDVKEVNTSEGVDCTVRSRITHRITDVEEDIRGRTAKDELAVQIVERNPEDAFNCPMIDRNPWPVTVVVLEGKVYFLSPFLASVGKTQVHQSLRQGVAVMEQWRQLPRYVFPLKIGFIWTDGKERYQVVARGPKLVGSHLFPDSFKIIGKTSDGDIEEWFCPGVGPIQIVITNRTGRMEQSISSYGKQ